MFSNSEIKQRFEENRWPIDRHGNYVDTNPDRDLNESMLPLTLHYRLLAGMTDKEAEAALSGTYALSAFEIAFLIKSTKAFIKDVLEIDLEEIRKNKNTTATLCGQLVIEVVAEINLSYETRRFENVTINGQEFQADQGSRNVLVGFLAAGAVPEYWTRADNTAIECTHDLLVELQTAISERDAAYHAQATELKVQARQLSEARDYAGLMSLREEVKAL